MEFQHKIIKLLITDKSLFTRLVSIIKSEYFEDSRISIIVEILLKFYKKYKSLPDIITIKQECYNYQTDIITTEELISLVEEINNSQLIDTDHLKDSILDFFRNQAFKSFVLDCSDHISNKAVLPNQLADMRKQMDEVIHLGNNLDNLGHFFFDTELITQRILNRKEGLRQTAVPTGLSYFDYLLGGGLCNGELGIILAPTGKGKSIALTFLGKSAILKNKNVFHYSLEMSEEGIASRYDACFLGEYYNKLNEFSDELKSKLESVWNQFKKHLIIKRMGYMDDNLKKIKKKKK
jgi:replicative DNA helicase